LKTKEAVRHWAKKQRLTMFPEVAHKILNRKMERHSLKQNTTRNMSISVCHTCRKPSNFHNSRIGFASFQNKPLWPPVIKGDRSVWNAQHSGPTKNTIHAEDVCHLCKTQHASDVTSLKHGEANAKNAHTDKRQCFHFDDTTELETPTSGSLILTSSTRRWKEIMGKLCPNQPVVAKTVLEDA